MKGAENEELLFKRYKVTDWNDEKFLEMGSGDGYIVLQMYLMPLNCTLKNGCNGKLMDIIVQSELVKITKQNKMGI